ncbi:MAG: CheR family methyltransferase [Desulfuromonadaceae bacterium]
MSSGFNQTTLAELSRQIARRMGLHFPPSQWGLLERAFSRAAEELGHASALDCAHRFLAPSCPQGMIESLASFLTIGETYFFRENQGFESLEREILPAIIHRQQGKTQRLRFWSAGCATGEEPYSLAILLNRMSHLLAGWEISILATDINQKSLQKARAGIYTDYSFRNTPNWVRQKYFRKQDKNRYELLPSIINRVKFAYFNLIEDPCPTLFTDTNAMDVIFCRNVLMYFSEDQAKQVIERLRRCLVEGGWLLVSPCELSTTLYGSFSPVNFPETTFYRKQSLRTASPLSPAPIPAGLQPPIAVVPPPVEKITVPAPCAPLPKPAQQSPSDYQKALLSYQQGAYDQAVEQIGQHLVRNPDDASALALSCRIHANQGKLVEALQLAEQAIECDKLHSGLHYLRAMILLELGQTGEAALSLRRVLYLDQNMVLAHFTLGNLALNQGKSHESHRHFKQALNLLDEYEPEECLPESEGLPAGRLKNILRSMADVA